VRTSTLNRIPFVAPQVIPLFVSGLTAAIGLYEVGEMKSGETVLVTGLYLRI
jgi:NADPH-dependent curcumin reductase CurA